MNQQQYIDASTSQSLAQPMLITSSSGEILRVREMI